MPEQEKSHIPKPHYLASLDPWIPSSYKDVEWLLKLGLLTSSRLAISDNQAINNKTFQKLLQRPDLLSFLLTPENDGFSPIAISLRESASSFDEVLCELIINREKPARLSWLNVDQQQRIDYLYSKGKTSSLGPLFDIGGQDFIQHIANLNHFLSIKNSAIIPWKGLQGTYLNFAKGAISQFIHGISAENLEDKELILNLCQRMLESIESKGEVNRSNLYRLLTASPLASEVKKTLELKLLTEPYHKNFAHTSNFHMITGSEYRKSFSGNLFPEIASRLKEIKVEDIIEIDMFPVLLEQIPYTRIQKIRSSPTFKSLTKRIPETAEEKRVYILRDLLNLLYAELSCEPKGVSKLGKIRIKTVSTPKALKEQLAEAGISFADLLSSVNKATGFLAGEIAGETIGLFGVGGLVGTAVGTVIEQVTERAFLEPSRKNEFRQIVNLLSTDTNALTGH
ncbi:hypothetical protein [Coleofasciculus sp. FACHB-129]|uniref:hypothetical protein n=1 Tax=Cyanophyceae TaxID=3028117 RepID=UPI0016844548|nr:hypothetical protein [Coleofasciculus sp. FACHB-129]MBD1893206.1 hypothetical protein [Coleofasciculus sp. FACHB-129]